MLAGCAEGESPNKPLPHLGCAAVHVQKIDASPEWDGPPDLLDELEARLARFHAKHPSLKKGANTSKIVV